MGEALDELEGLVDGEPNDALWAVIVGYRRAEQRMAAALGLGPSDLTALQHLTQHPEAGPKDLAELLGMRSASVTALVDRLEAAGHVERRPHPRDRRRRQLVVTQHAEAEMARVLGPLFAALSTLAKELTDEERATVTRFLSRVAALHHRALP